MVQTLGLTGSAGSAMVAGLLPPPQKPSRNGAQKATSGADSRDVISADFDIAPNKSCDGWCWLEKEPRSKVEECAHCGCFRGIFDTADCSFRLDRRRESSNCRYSGIYRNHIEPSIWTRSCVTSLLGDCRVQSTYVGEITRC